MSITDATARPALTSQPEAVSLSSLDHSDWPVIGARGARLARATRMGLPMPEGVVLPPTSIGSLEPGDPVHRTDDSISHIFNTLGHGGQTPLVVTMSSISPPNSSADSVAPVRAISTHAELTHTIRRFSVTSTVLGDSVAIVIQRDVTPTLAGCFVVQPGPRYDHPINDSVHSRARRRLMSLGRDVGRAFRGAHTITWAIDPADQIWILDIGPEHINGAS